MWCRDQTGSVIGPYSFIYENDCPVTVSEVRYRAIVRRLFLVRIGCIWHQLYMVPTKWCHMPHCWCNFEKWFGRLADSLKQFNAVHFLLMELCLLYTYYIYIIYTANMPTTLEKLRNNITINTERKISKIPADICGRVMENWLQRIDHCQRARADHINQIKFHS